MKSTIQERLQRKRKAKGRSSFDDDVDSSPIIYADIPGNTEVKDRIIKREKAAYLPMDEKVKVFEDLSIDKNRSEDSHNSVIATNEANSPVNASITGEDQCIAPIPLPYEEFQPNQVQSRSKPGAIGVQSGCELSANQVQTGFNHSATKLDSLTHALSHKYIEHTSFELGKVTEEKIESKEQAQPEAGFVDALIQANENQGANQVQSGSEPSANQVQTQSKLRDSKTEPGADQVQSRFNPGSEPGAILGAKPGATLNRTSSDLLPKVRYSSLSGTQKIIVDHIYEGCKESREKFTDAISTKDLVRITESPLNSVQSAIKRLKLKDVIALKEYKDGPGGWSVYWLADLIYQEMLGLEAKGKLIYQLASKKNLAAENHSANLGAKPGANLGASGSSISSSSLKDINKENTNTSQTDPPNFAGLPEEWKLIDQSSLEEFGIKLYANEILGIYRAQQNPSIEGEALTSRAVQESIYELAYDLSKGMHKDSRFNPRATLVGRLMKKLPYTAKSNGYFSPDLLARQERAKRLEAERKALEEQNETIFNATFELWFHRQDKKKLRAKRSTYSFCDHDNSLKLTVKEDFRSQNFSRIIYENVEDVSLLDLDFEPKIGEESDLPDLERTVPEYQSSPEAVAIAQLNEKIAFLNKNLALSELADDVRAVLETKLADLKNQRKQLIASDPLLSEHYKDIEQFDAEFMQLGTDFLKTEDLSKHA